MMEELEYDYAILIVIVIQFLSVGFISILLLPPMCWMVNYLPIATFFRTDISHIISQGGQFSLNSIGITNLTIPVLRGNQSIQSLRCRYHCVLAEYSL